VQPCSRNRTIHSIANDFLVKRISAIAAPDHLEKDRRHEPTRKKSIKIA
jgi:hypothetical protein